MHKTSTPSDPQTRRRARRKRMVAVIPSLLTLGNAACGFGCITYAAKVGPEPATPNDLHFAAMLIFGAMLFDALDGPIARLAKLTSKFGAHLDSLADAISFGVAPAFLMLKFSRGFPPRLLWMIAVLYLLCAVLRLARFNVTCDDDPSHSSFCGLPSPAAAGMIASLVIVGPGLLEWTAPEATDSVRQAGEFLLWGSSVSMPVITLAVACLMVSRIRYPHVVSQLFQGRRSFQHLVKLIFTIVIVFAIHELAIPILFFYFVAGSPLRALWSQAMLRRARAETKTPGSYEVPT